MELFCARQRRKFSRGIKRAFPGSDQWLWVISWWLPLVFMVTYRLFMAIYGHLYRFFKAIDGHLYRLFMVIYWSFIGYFHDIYGLFVGYGICVVDITHINMEIFMVLLCVSYVTSCNNWSLRSFHWLKLWWKWWKLALGQVVYFQQKMRCTLILNYPVYSWDEYSYFSDFYLFPWDNWESRYSYFLFWPFAQKKTDTNTSHVFFGRALDAWSWKASQKWASREWA